MGTPNNQGKHGKKRKVYMVCDERARSGAGTDESVILAVESSLLDARKWKPIWTDGCVYSFDSHRSQLSNETWVEDF